jgi:archaellum component FlaG (FlaF/FlaG flagellin family)
MRASAAVGISGPTNAAARRARHAALVVFVAGLMFVSAVAAPAPSQEDAAIAQDLAELLRDARTVISNNQDLINNPEIGDKHLTGQVVLDQALKIYAKATGVDPKAIDPNSRRGRLLRAMMAAIVAVTDENQATINKKGTGFKAFIPAVFGRLVSEDFDQMAKGEAAVKVTAPPELVRNRKARPDAWEADIIKTKLLSPGWPKGQPYSAVVDTDGHPAFRVMVPEYYVASCLSCHGSPKGEMDITGYPKEGGKLDDLGAAISITLFH